MIDKNKPKELEWEKIIDYNCPCFIHTNGTEFVGKKEVIKLLQLEHNKTINDVQPKSNEKWRESLRNLIRDNDLLTLIAPFDEWKKSVNKLTEKLEPFIQSLLTQQRSELLEEINGFIDKELSEHKEGLGKLQPEMDSRTLAFHDIKVFINNLK